MPDVATCPRCGSPLPSEGWEGLCPNCVVRVSLEAPTAAQGAGTVWDPGAPEPQQPRLPQTGATIGRYKLLQQIGEGGFGVVFMAEQLEPVQRKVALKVIKAGMDTREVIARFEAERQALALMDHPNIAQVLDGGATASGRPYFVMELVRGLPITQYCDQCNLSTRERLELFIKVCRAVQHAHQKGVIHRDLKPTNVLVTLHDGEPVPKVIDFGVAKALGQKLTNKTLFTRFEQMLGTPAYMSPEQAALSGLDIDTRSDVYSLGVLLYELLTGVTPFDGETLRQAALDEVRRMIQETEPPRPSTRLLSLGERLADVARHRDVEAAVLPHLVRGDLDWITMKALEKDRRRRYEAVNGLAADVERHLNLEPVLAGPPTARYRVKKFVRKHRGAVAAAAGVVLLLTAATVLSMGLAGWANRERHRAEQNAAKSQQSAQFLKEILKDMERSVRIERSMGRPALVSTTFDANVERLARDVKDQPVLEAELRKTIGGVYLGLGEYAKAETMFREELALQKKLLGDEDVNVATAQYALAVSLENQGKLAESEALFYKALDIRKKLLGSESLEVVLTRLALGEFLEKQRRYAEASAEYREAVAVARASVRNELPTLEDRLYNLAELFYRQSNYAEAEPLYRELIETRRAGRAPGDDDVVTPTAALARLFSDWALADVTDRGRSPSSSATNASVRLGISNSANNLDALRTRPGTALAPYERARQAEALLHECLAFRLAANDNHWRSDEVISRLGGALLAVALTDPALSAEDRQTKLAEAEALLLDGNKRLQRSPYPDRKYKRDALERLVRLYEAWEISVPNTGKSAQAQNWRRKLEAFRDAGKDGLGKQETQSFENEQTRK